MGNEENGNMEMPQVSGNSTNSNMAEQINQSNNVLPQQNGNMNQEFVQQPFNGGMNPNGNVTAKGLDTKAIIAICAVAFVVFLLILVILFGGGSKGVAKKYGKYYVKGDYKKIVELYHEDVVEALESGSYSYDLKDKYKDLFKNYDKNDMKIKSYKIVDSQKVKGEKLEDFKDSIEDEYDIDDKDVKAIEYYLIKYKIDNDGEPDFEYDMIITVKIKNKWYVMGYDSI